MFLLDFLPDWLFHLITVVGILGLVAGFLLSSIPVIKTYAREIQLAAIIVTVVAVWFEGGIANNSKWEKRVADLEIKVARAEAESANLNAQLVQQLANNQALIRENTIAQRERLKAEAALLNKECRVNNRVISILNDAAQNRQEAAK